MPGALRARDAGNATVRLKQHMPMPISLLPGKSAPPGHDSRNAGGLPEWPPNTSRETWLRPCCIRPDTGDESVAPLADPSDLIILGLTFPAPGQGVFNSAIRPRPAWHFAISALSDAWRPIQTYNYSVLKCGPIGGPDRSIVFARLKKIQATRR